MEQLPRLKRFLTEVKGGKVRKHCGFTPRWAIRKKRRKSYWQPLTFQTLM